MVRELLGFWEIFRDGTTRASAIGYRLWSRGNRRSWRSARADDPQGAIGWDEIDEYRLEIEMRSAREDLRLLEPDVWDVVMFARGLQGQSPRRYGLELRGHHTSVFFNWRFKHHDDAVRMILNRIDPVLRARADADLERINLVAFGPLGVRRDALLWGKYVLDKDRIEALELFDSTEVTLRILVRGRVLPYASVPVKEIPNVRVALELADSLGFRVQGRELI